MYWQLPRYVANIVEVLLHNRLFIDLPTEELTAIRTLFTNNFGALADLRIIRHKKAAFARHDIFRLVETEAPHIPNRSEWLAFVKRVIRLRRILNHEQIVLLSYCPDGIHLAGDTRVVHGNNRSRPRRNRRFNQLLIEIERIGTNIDKNGHRTLQDERIRRRTKRIGRHNDLVAWLQIRTNRRDFKRCCARMHEQILLASKLFFEKSVHALRPLAIARNMPIGKSFRDVLHRFRCRSWNIKFNQGLPTF